MICVANGFTRYDEHAVQQISRAIELVRYQDFEGELLALELITAGKSDQSASTASLEARTKKPATVTKTVSDYLTGSPQGLNDLFANLETFIESLGDDVTKKVVQSYFAYRRLKNLACVEVHPQDADASGVPQGERRRTPARRGVQPRRSKHRSLRHG